MTMTQRYSQIIAVLLLVGLSSCGANQGDASVLDTAVPVGFPCRGDPDCCIKIDDCRNISYLYSIAPGAAPATSIPPDSGMCTACMPPPIQVRCVSSQCVGYRLSSFTDALLVDHCGYVTLPDGGATALEEAAGDIGGTTTSAWACGG